MNQGVGKRTLFENRRDTRLFLSKWARVVRKADLEVHAYCVMPNHYHALVRSLCGRMSASLQWIQDGFARYFNRSRSRVGSVFRGRFRSEAVTTADYWHTLVWYIDQNPVLDGLVQVPAEYPWGSAAQYARDRGPRWLSRELVQSLHYDRERELAESLSAERRERVLRLLGARLRLPRFEKDPLNLLLSGSSEEVRRWIENRALNADAIRAGFPVVTPQTVIEVVTRDLRSPEVPLDLQQLGAWALVTACGASRTEAARCLGVSKSTAQKRLEQFRDRLRHDANWIRRAEKFLRSCLSVDHPFAKLGERSLTRLFT